MTSAPPDWINGLADRLENAQCWHLAPKAFGRGYTTKWWDLSPTDVAEAALRLRQYAQAMAARSGETSGSAEGNSAVPQECATTPKPEQDHANG